MCPIFYKVKNPTCPYVSCFYAKLQPNLSFYLHASYLSDSTFLLPMQVLSSVGLTKATWLIAVGVL